MDTSATITELAKGGYTSTNWYSNSPPNPARPISALSSRHPPKKTVRALRIDQRIAIEQDRLAHLRGRIGVTKQGGLHTHVREYYREEMHQCRQRLTWYEEQLSLASVAQQSVQFGNRQLDLHGFTRASALAVVEQRLDELRGAGHGHLTIICGRGLHSMHGRPRLKPAIHRYLTQEHIEYTQPFEGTFRVSVGQLRRPRA